MSKSARAHALYAYTHAYTYAYAYARRGRVCGDAQSMQTLGDRDQPLRAQYSPREPYLDWPPCGLF